MVNKSNITGKDSFHTTFGKLVTYESLNETIDADYVESCLEEVYPDGQFDDPREFIDFAKKNFDTEVDCTFEWNSNDSGVYVYVMTDDGDFNNKAFTFFFSDDDIFNKLDEKYDGEWTTINYVEMMLEDMDEFFNEPNFE